MLVILLAVTPVLKALLVLVWARRSHTPWRDIGYVRPRSWTRSLAIGLAFGATFKIVMKALVMPLLGAAPVNSAYHYIVGNPAALPGMLLAVTVGAGFGEETLFRGYLFERLRKLLGGGPSRTAVIVVVTSVLFALAHLREQGLTGAEQALVTGLVFGSIFAMTGRLFHPDGCARGIRSHGDRSHLLESRSGDGAPSVQMTWCVLPIPTPRRSEGRSG